MNSFFNSVNILCSTDSIVNSERETLADFVRRVRKEKGYSLAKVQERSGGNIAPSYLHKIENGDVRNVSPEKLIAVAKGLGVSEDETFAVARGKTTGNLTLEEMRLLGDFRILPPDRKELLLDMAANLANKKKRALHEVKEPHSSETPLTVYAPTLTTQGRDSQIGDKPGDICVPGFSHDSKSKNEMTSEPQESGGRTRKQRRR